MGEDMVDMTGTDAPPGQAVASPEELGMELDRYFPGMMDGVQRFVDGGEVHAFSNSIGAIMFVKSGEGTYKVTLALGSEGRTGLDVKTYVNDAFQWMFENTDAVLILGYIPTANVGCLSLAPHAYGYRLDPYEWGYMLVIEKAAFQADRIAKTGG